MLTANPELGPGGHALWDAITDEYNLDAAQRVQLEEACRAKDRLDDMAQVLAGDVSEWASVVPSRDGGLELRISPVLTEANKTADLLKRLLAALRLPDRLTGKRPQRRGARGVYRPRGGGG